MASPGPAAGRGASTATAPGSGWRSTSRPLPPVGHRAGTARRVGQGPYGHAEPNPLLSVIGPPILNQSVDDSQDKRVVAPPSSADDRPRPRPAIAEHAIESSLVEAQGNLDRLGSPMSDADRDQLADHGHHVRHRGLVDAARERGDLSPGFAWRLDGWKHANLHASVIPRLLPRRTIGLPLSRASRGGLEAHRGRWASFLLLTLAARDRIVGSGARAVAGAMALGAAVVWPLAAIAGSEVRVGKGR